MLPFQKEPGQLPLKTEVPPKDTGADAAKKAPADTDDKNQQYLTVADKKGQVRHSTYLLAGLFVIGVVCLFLMIKKSSPNTAAAQPAELQSEQTRIEQAIAKITGVRSQMYSSLEKIVKKFYEFADFEQINVDELSKNPFKKDNRLADSRNDDQERRAVTVEGQLELLTIMETEKGNCCMINDKLLYEGDMINGMQVQKITYQTVILGNEQSQIVLRLVESF